MTAISPTEYSVQIDGGEADLGRFSEQVRSSDELRERVHGTPMSIANTCVRNIATISSTASSTAVSNFMSTPSFATRFATRFAPRRSIRS